MNIFEGARRIAKISAAVWTVGCIFYAINNSPSVSATYQIPNFGSKPVLSDGCPEDAAREYASSWQHSTMKGTDISLTLCFLAVDGFTGTKSSKLIPYKVDESTHKLWGNEKYSADVSTYTRKVIENFRIPEEDFSKFDAQHRTLWWKEFFTSMQVMITGLVAIFGFTWAIGYVTRGFLGIPNKADTRQNVETEK